MPRKAWNNTTDFNNNSNSNNRMNNNNNHNDTNQPKHEQLNNKRTDLIREPPVPKALKVYRKSSNIIKCKKNSNMLDFSSFLTFSANVKQQWYQLQGWYAEFLLKK